MATSRSSALIIGGGPAGLATAIALARTGFSVHVAEPRTGSIDKCCGEGLLPAAIEALRALGLSTSELLDHGQQFTGIRFVSGGSTAEASFGSRAGVGMRRTQLHALLHQHAANCGVRHIAGPARLLSGSGDSGEGMRVEVGGRQFAADYVIAADGQQSQTRKAAGLSAGHVVSRRFALRQHFLLAAGVATPDCVVVYWKADAQAYLTPVAPGLVGIAVLSKRRVPDMETALALFPVLQCMLEQSHPTSAPRGYVTMHQMPGGVTAGRLALIGDASGTVDAITGDGLALAFKSALALAHSLKCGNLSDYAAEHRRLYRVPRLMSRVLLGMGSHPMVTRTCMDLLGGVPGLFQGLLRVHAAGPRHAISSLQEEKLWLPAPTSTRSVT